MHYNRSRVTYFNRILWKKMYLEIILCDVLTSISIQHHIAYYHLHYLHTSILKCFSKFNRSSLLNSIMCMKIFGGTKERVKLKKSPNNNSSLQLVTYVSFSIDIDSHKRKHIVLMMDGSPCVSRTSVIILSKYVSRSNESHYINA